MIDEDIHRYMIRLMHYLVMNKEAFTTLPDEEWIQVATKVSIAASMLVNNERLLIVNDDEAVVASTPIPS